MPENFQPLPDDLKPEIQEQLERLGIETARQVAQRCLDKKARTWRYLLTSLRNENVGTAKMPSAAPDYTKWATPDDDLGLPSDDLSTPAAGDSTSPQRFGGTEVGAITNPHITPTFRAAVVQPIWDAACAQLIDDYGCLFEPIIRTLTLVDFDPAPRQFTAVFHQPPGRKFDYHTAHGAILQVLIRMMGRDIHLSFAPHFHWRQPAEQRIAAPIQVNLFTSAGIPV